MEDEEPNITPIMNLMVCLIPLLLSVGMRSELALLEYLPPAEATAAEGVGAPPDEGGAGKIEKLNLLINLAETGVQVSIYEKVVGEYFYEIPLLPDGSYDWSTVKDSLWAIKQREVGEPIGSETVTDEVSGEMKEIPKYRLVDGEEVSITATGGTQFQKIINAMDACRFYDVGNERMTMFPITMLKQFQ